MDTDDKQGLNKPTLADIAQHLGISTMTVSRALRGTDRVSQKTIEKVQAAARELGYTPNPLVQTLMSSVRNKRVTRTANIAWVTTYAENESTPVSLKTILQGGKNRANELGYNLDYFHINRPDLSPKAVRNIFRARSIQGAVISPMKQPGKIPNFPWDEFAVSTIGRSLESPNLHYVMAHYYHGMQRILEELTQRGYQRIALLTSSTLEARADYAGVMVFHHHCILNDIDPQLAYQRKDAWSDSTPQRWFEAFQPDAIISDYSMRYARLAQAGLPMEQIGFASLSWNEKFSNCAGLRQPFEALGSAAVDLVVAQLHRNERGVPKERKAMLMEAKWVEGETLRSKTENAGAKAE